MATYSFPALGFDPAPGDPDAIDAVARECLRCAADLAEDADQLQRLTAHVDWQGEGANAFAAHPAQLHADLCRARDAYGGTGAALRHYSGALRQAKVDARRLEAEAADARLRADRHEAKVEQLSQAIDIGASGATADQAWQLEAARRLEGGARDDYGAAVARARLILQTHTETGDRAAARIRALSDAPYHEPGLLSRLAGGAADWVSAHADTLRAVSNVLKTVSAIAGALSFIPALTPIFAPIAGLTAAGAVAIDGALVAAGHGDWKELAVDAALLALPGAGRIASRTMMSARGEALVADDASRALRLSRTRRPGTVATLVTRSLGKSVFHGSSGVAEALHPRLVEALDRVPMARRSPFHGKCAEINTIDSALKAGARIRDSVMRAMKVRPITHAEHEVLHKPCSSCEHVMREMSVRTKG